MSASNFQSSFIPKGTGGFTSSNFEEKPHTSLFGTIVIVFFVITLLVTAGLIGYKQVVKSSIQDLESELALAESSVDTETIDTMFVFSKKLAVGKSIIMRHRVVSNFLTLLSQNTIQSISFKDFNYQFMPEGDISIVLSGLSTSYSSLALQEDILRKVTEIKNADFSELALSEGGLVSFKLSLLVDPSSALYAKEAPVVTTELDEEEEDASLLDLDLDIPDLDNL